MTISMADILYNAAFLEIYRMGIKKGVWWFAVWKSGEQVVGIHEQPIDKVYEDIDRGMYDE